MPDIEHLYAFVAREATSEADGILSEALAAAEPDYAVRIIRILLNRGTDTAWTGLIMFADRLSPEQERRLLERPDLVAKAVGPALQGARGQGLRGALRVLRLCPNLQVAPLLADLLTQCTDETRLDAANLLRSWAESLLPTYATGTHGPPKPVDPDDRAAVVRALRRALGTFERHQQAEVLEAALWYAPDLGQVLWSSLEGLQAAAAALVARRLPQWSRPRMAGFLLLALSQPRWKDAALEILSKWSTPAELSAILGHTELLTDPTIAPALRALHQPAWLANLGPDLRELPPTERVLVPYWVAMLGMPERERIQCLQRWLASDEPAMQRAALQALALMNSPRVTNVVAQASQRGGQAMRFARWYVIGRAAAEQREPPQAHKSALVAQSTSAQAARVAR